MQPSNKLLFFISCIDWLFINLYLSFLPYFASILRLGYIYYHVIPLKKKNYILSLLSVDLIFEIDFMTVGLLSFFVLICSEVELLACINVFHFLFPMSNCMDSECLEWRIIYWIQDWWSPCLILLQIFSMWWINWHLYLCLLPVLLLCTLRYVWVYANLIFLWLHGLHLLWFLPHAWNCRFPCSFTICASHLSIHQVWVDGWSSSRVVCHVFSSFI